MKNLTKIFTAVVAGLLAFSCVTDTTEDLGVNMGNGVGQTTITLSLEESRTQLGNKTAEGLYPLYWSAGDKISVNGIESNEAVIDGENGAYATFIINGTTETPYCVAYPAAPQGQVVFAEKQSHVVEGNTFASGVSTMYGYSTTNGVAMNHLTGVLKLGIVGEATLSKVQISTIDRAPIAGNFDIDFESGELTATSLSKDVIEYSFGEEGATLSAEPTYIHVAVPAGKYDELYLTLYEKGNSGNVMYATVKAGESKPLTVGNVRSFKQDLIYIPNSRVFVINSVETLQNFKTAVESEEGLAMDALFTEDVDLTDVEWVSIDGTKYTNTIIGNGYAIKGLNAPLFSTTSASVKALHFEDVNITSNDVVEVGAFAGVVTATDEVVPTISNCSVRGELKMDNPTLTGIDPRLGALVGTAHGVAFDGCVNYATVTAPKVYASGSTNVFLGGIAGITYPYTKSDDTVVYSTVHNSKNYGEVTYNSSVKAGNTIYVGGISGASQKDNVGIEFIACENHGTISIETNAAAGHMGGISGYVISGAAAFSDATQNCTNRGKVYVKSGATISGQFRIGGIFGTGALNMLNSHNYGIVECEVGSKTGETDIGGLFGVGLCQTIGGTKYTAVVSDCSNNGAVIFGASNPTATASEAFRFGGISGYTQNALTNCINNGKVTLCGTRNLKSRSNATTTNKYRNGTYLVSGIVGYKTEGKITNCQNHGDIEVSATIVDLYPTYKNPITEKDIKRTSELKVAGIVSYVSTNLVGTNVSDGEILISGTFGCEVDVAGSIAYTYAAQNSESSSSKIKVTGTLNGGLIAGGVISWTPFNYETGNFNGSIEITESAVVDSLCYVGGCVGRLFSHTTTARTITSLTNNGEIKIGGTLKRGCRIGGCVGTNTVSTEVASCAYGKLSSLTNNKDITITATTTGANAYVAGCVANTSDGTTTTAVNNGKITIDGSHTGGNGYFAGCVADGTANCTGLTNNGDVICPSTSVFKSPRLGGLCGYITGTVTGTNLGNVTFAGTSTGNTYITGIAYRGRIRNSTNGSESDATKGVLTYSGTAGTETGKGSCYFGGLVYDSYESCSDSKNYGAINIGGSMSYTLYGGGLSTTAIDNTHSMTNCENHGKITVTATIGIPGVATMKGADCFVGGFAYNVSTAETMRTYINCHNYGDIEISDQAKIAGAIRFGGMFGNLEDADVKITLDGCTNSGNIISKAKNSIGESSNYAFGGCMGSLQSNANVIVKNSLINNGNVSMSGENPTSYVSVGGVIGMVNSTNVNVVVESGAIINTGEVSYTGKVKTHMRVGGIAGLASSPLTGAMINTGKVSATGTAEGASTYVGGIAAQTSKAISNAQCYAEVYGIGYAGTGMITGSPKSDAVVLTNCAVGGKMTCKEVTGADANGDDITVKQTVTLGDSSNIDDLQTTEWTDYWYKYIYGSENPTSVEEATGVTLLTAAPSLDVNPAPEEGDTTETPEA